MNLTDHIEIVLGIQISGFVNESRVRDQAVEFSGLVMDDLLDDLEDDGLVHVLNRELQVDDRRFIILTTPEGECINMSIDNSTGTLVIS